MFFFLTANFIIFTTHQNIFQPPVSHIFIQPEPSLAPLLKPVVILYLLRHHPHGRECWKIPSQCSPLFLQRQSRLRTMTWMSLLIAYTSWLATTTIKYVDASPPEFSHSIEFF